MTITEFEYTGTVSTPYGDVLLTSYGLPLWEKVPTYFRRNGRVGPYTSPGRQVAYGHCKEFSIAPVGIAPALVFDRRTGEFVLFPETVYGENPAKAERLSVSDYIRSGTPYRMWYRNKSHPNP